MLEATLVDVCSSRPKELVLDLAGLEFMDSTGLSAILRGKALCEASGCVYSVTPAQRPVERVFDATGVRRKLGFRKPATEQTGAG
jgi:anti-anti-sigma factor